jgi:hypothetical protein
MAAMDWKPLCTFGNGAKPIVTWLGAATRGASDLPQVLPRARQAGVSSVNRRSLCRFCIDGCWVWVEDATTAPGGPNVRLGCDHEQQLAPVPGH